MFTIQLSRNPDATEVQRAMSVIGLIAGIEVMQTVGAALRAGGAVPQPPLVGPTPDSAFSPPAPVPAAPADAAVKDSAGFPWNEQIHSSAKSFNKSDGTWKKKRGVQDATVTAVEAQMRLVYPAPGPQGAFTAPPPPPPVGQVPPPPPPGTAPVTNLPNPVPPPPAATGALDFIGLMGKITAHIGAGKITQQDVATTCQQFGVASAPLLAQRPDLIPSVGATLDALAMSRP